MWLKRLGQNKVSQAIVVPKQAWQDLVCGVGIHAEGDEVCRYRATGNGYPKLKVSYSEPSLTDGLMAMWDGDGRMYRFVSRIDGSGYLLRVKSNAPLDESWGMDIVNPAEGKGVVWYEPTDKEGERNNE